MRVALPVAESRGGLYLIPHFGRAGKFAVVEISGEWRVVEVFDNPGLRLEGGGRAEAIAEALSARGVSTVIVYEIGPGAFNRLKARGFRILGFKEKPRAPVKLESVREELEKGGLVELEQPNEEEHG
jgi:predicted Fe-Mo cluster-binding NifX family protein